jgi:hypothetical protein
MKLLLTAGPTREHLDPIRFLSNGSSGRMGFALAEAAVARGLEVDLVCGPVALPAPAGVRLHRVVSAADMLAACEPCFAACDVFMAVAAVADYRPGTGSAGGPILAERQWGTVREDYSRRRRVATPGTTSPTTTRRSRAYRWGEDGLLGFTDGQCRLCFALALWNGRDPILKERLFGLTGPEGNHGEDVKEVYYYLDATPTHSYGHARRSTSTRRRSFPTRG